jgi:hypothetical protein
MPAAVSDTNLSECDLVEANIGGDTIPPCNPLARKLLSVTMTTTEARAYNPSQDKHVSQPLTGNSPHPPKIMP